MSLFINIKETHTWSILTFTRLSIDSTLMDREGTSSNTCGEISLSKLHCFFLFIFNRS